MNKFIAILAVLLLAAPAMAADWSFYGSARMATFYVADDFGDATIAGENDDWGLVWDFQANSRLGARVKADKVSGHIELGLKGTTGDIDVGTRRAYGVWKFADMASLKVGKDYSPVTKFISSQAFATDDGLLGSGNFYGGRPGMLGLTIAGLDLALITNSLTTSGGINPAGTDLDWNLPKLELCYNLNLGMIEIRPFGGIQYYKVSKGTSALTDDIDVYSYVIGGDVVANIGAFMIGAQGAWGKNWTNAGWAGARTGIAAAASSVSLKGTDDTNDAVSWSAMLVTGLKLTDTLKFEVGGGYRRDDSDVSGTDYDDMWQVYGQATITLAPGVFLIPEVGYLDKRDNAAGADEGYQWYAGAKWQIDF